MKNEIYGQERALHSLSKWGRVGFRGNTRDSPLRLYTKPELSRVRKRAPRAPNSEAQLRGITTHFPNVRGTYLFTAKA